MTTPTTADTPAYLKEVPEADDLAKRLQAAIEYWKPRNDFFAKQRSYVEGTNKIPFPEAAPFKIETTHTGLLAAAVNEKASRFLLQPTIAVVPEGVSADARNSSTELEAATNSLFYWMDLKGDGDVWGRQTIDAITYDMGVSRIEWIGHSRWPDISTTDEGSGKEKLWAKASKRGAVSKKAYAKLRDDYKKEQGAPFREVYVPPWCFFPVYEGSDLVESFEIEQRSLRSVLSNPLFAGNLTELKAAAAGLKGSAAMKQQVTIVHYATDSIHAYYALIPASETRWTEQNKWPDASEASVMRVGKPVYLYHYRHDNGRSIYNVMGGRFSSWKTEHSSIEPISNVLCDIVQDADELASQVKTNLRATYWSTLVTHYDPEYRDSTALPPAPPKIADGTPIALWKGEDMKPLFVPTANPMLEWYYTQLMTQIGRLTGGASLYGQHEQGVSTGFHANLQITQSEHLDERLESHVAQAAINRALIIYSYIRSRDETVFVYYTKTDDMGRKHGKYISIDPAKITPYPELDSKVKRQSPINFGVAVRTAIDATSDRHGPGTPLYDDDTALERILGEDKPDMIKKKVWIQNEQQKLVDQNVLSQRIAERLNVLLVQNSTPNVTGEQAANADPALLAATAGINAQSAEAAQGGGVSPQVLQALMSAGAQNGVPQVGAGGAPPPPNEHNISTGPPGRMGQGGGLPVGASQPEAANGRAVQLAVQSARRGGG
jgi:hypothetical protein